MALYLTWMLATYVTEGRLGLLLRPNSDDLVAYGLIANIFVGVGLAALVLRLALSSKTVTLEQVGLRSWRRLPLAVVLAGLGGIGLFVAQNPYVADPLTLVNAFAYILPIAIAEVLVCWAALGTSLESLTHSQGRVFSTLTGILGANLFFSLYHFARSSPYNQPEMVFFFFLPGLVTSLIYFVLERDLYATIWIQSLLGMIGLIRSATDLTPFREPHFSSYLVAIGAVLALVACDRLIWRKATKSRVF
jgi:hypothetical protein